MSPAHRPPRKRPEAARLHQRRSDHRPQRGLRYRFPGPGARRNGKFIEGGYFDTLTIAREGYPDPRVLQARRRRQVLRHHGRDRSSRSCGRRDDGCHRGQVCRRSSEPHRDLGEGITVSIRANRKEARLGWTSGRSAPPGSRQQEPVPARPEEDRSKVILPRGSASTAVA